MGRGWGSLGSGGEGGGGGGVGGGCLIYIYIVYIYGLDRVQNLGPKSGVQFLDSRQTFGVDKTIDREVLLTLKKS